MMMEVVDRVRRISLEKINSEKGRMGLWKRQMVANILTATIAMLNVSTKRRLSDPDSVQDNKKVCRSETGLEWCTATAEHFNA